MNRYHLIAILGFILGLLTAATLMFAYLGDPNAVTSGFAGLATIWLIYSYVPEEGTFDRSECLVCGGCRKIESMGPDPRIVECPYCKTPEALRATLKSQQPVDEDNHPFATVGKQPKD